jgi:predicted ribonuclease YlaK
VDSVRDKSEKVIRLVKECRRRGRLTEGVPLVTGVSEIIAIAIEPDMNKSLPWLDPQNNDDRLLAVVIEVMRMRPGSPVVLVSRDINLQNKAEFARVPFLEPPEPH